MSKTIKQIADELGVSKQAVHKRIAREPLHSSVYASIDKVDGVLYIAYTGEMLIKQAFSANDCIQVADNQPTTKTDYVYSVLKSTIDSLQGQINVKDEQIENAQKQIVDLTSALANMTASLNAAHALHAGTLAQQAQLPEKKKGWWNK